MKKTIPICVFTVLLCVALVTGLLYSLRYYAPFGKDGKSITENDVFPEILEKFSVIAEPTGKYTYNPGNISGNDDSVQSVSVTEKPVIKADKSSVCRFFSPDGKFVYFNQRWDEYSSHTYGDETVGTYGCGPVNICMIASTIKNKIYSPLEIADKAIEWDCFASGIGTKHAFFEKAAEYYGISYESIYLSEKNIKKYLSQGKYIIVSMGKGYFTNGGHFLTLRGITESGKILIADSYSEENTAKEWDLNFIISELKYNSGWVFGKK